MNFALVWCVCGEGRAAALGSIGIGRWGKTERADTQASMTGAGGKGVIFCTKLVWCAVRVLGTLRLGRLPEIARQYWAARMVRKKGGGLDSHSSRRGGRGDLRESARANKTPACGYV